MSERSSYRMAGTMAFLMGGAGLFVSWFGYQGAAAVIPVGLGVAAVSLLLMLGFVLASGPKAAPRMHPRAAAVPTPPIEPKAAPLPKAGELHFEYPETTQPPPVAIEPIGVEPRGTVVTTDPVAARPPRSMGRPVPTEPTVRARHEELAHKYTGGTPMVREILMQPRMDDVPEFQAEIADPTMHPSRMPHGTVRGKCGQCHTLLLAPTLRPIKLACPSCHKVTLLEG